MSEGKRNWTDEQLAAIRTIDRPLLVSAAAGSGKTSVLAERCVHLICDAEPNDRCVVSELLVVTFTRAAAAEMRQRIGANLRARDTGNDVRLQRQIQLLESANISTLHSFCTSVLRRHFNTVGLDPAFTTLDEADAMLLRNDVCREMIQNTYEGARGDVLSDFVDRYCSNSDESLRQRILRIYELRGSTVDPVGWSTAAVFRLTEAAGKPLPDAAIGRQFLNLLHFEVDGLVRRAQAIIPVVESESKKYGDHVRELAVEFESWRTVLASADFEAFGTAVAAWVENIPRLPIVRGASDRPKKLIDSLKTTAKGGLIGSAIPFTAAELSQTAGDTVEPVKLLLSLVDEFGARYSIAKQATRSVDFADLERLTFQVLTLPTDRTQPSPAAIAYRAQFKHVLVDEYQDINGLQDRILQLVSRDPTESAVGNFFCVGDVKQSIYRFRLADPSQFLHRAESYGSDPNRGRLIPLSKNFRSDPGIVGSVNAVFERLMSSAAAEIDYDGSHALHVGKPDDRCKQLVDPVELHLLPDADAAPSTEEVSAPAEDDAPRSDDDDDDRTEREAELSARLIQHLTSDGASPQFQYRDIAILLRSKKIRAEKFANRLRLRGIPVLADSTTGFFNAVEIRDMLSLLQCMDNLRQDIPLAALLRSPLAGLARPEDAMAAIRVANRKLPFHEAVFAFAHAGQDEVARTVQAFLSQLGKWREAVNLRPLAGLLWEILHETGYLAYCSLLPDGRQRVANLLALHDRARAFGQFSRQGLRRFLQFLEALRDEQDLGLPPAGDEPGNVVQVMSIHASKGLQFPVIIVPELGKKFNLGDTVGTMLVDRDEFVALQVVDGGKRAKWDSVATMVARRRIRQKLLAEEMRVLYVAMTRAENKLILTGTVKSPTDTLADWRQEWFGHHGPLPPDVILGASSMLDWLGPAAAAIEHSAGAIRISEHTLASLRGESGVSQRKRGPQDIMPEIRAFKPLQTVAPATPRAVDALAALAWEPPTLELTQVPAARAVTQLTKSGREAPAGDSPSLRSIIRFTPPLPMPRFTTPSRLATPTEVGNVTHHVLQAMDLSCPAARGAVQRAVAQLVERRTIRPEEAAAVDLDAICWFLDTPLCRKLSSRGVDLFRELPIFAPADDASKSAPPLDRVMLRGQIDVLGRSGEGLILADYKTDRVTNETMAARADFYRPQVETYRRMIESVVGLPVVETSLVFLVPRMIVVV